MKRFALAIVLLLCAVAPAQDVVVPGYGTVEANRAQAITVNGPDTAAVGREVTLRIDGTPAIDLGKPLLGQLEWLTGKGRMYVYIMSPGEAKKPVDVRGELVFSASGATMQPVLRIVCSKPGEHRVVIDWNHEQDQLVEHLIAVDGVAPQPDPKPGPDPPAPGSKWQVMFFIETDDLDNMPMAQRELVSGRAFREELESKGHRFMGALDKDQVVKVEQVCNGRSCTEVRSVKPELKAWWDAVKGDPMPRMAIASVDGGTIKSYPLPAGRAELYVLLEGAK